MRQYTGLLVSHKHIIISVPHLFCLKDRIHSEQKDKVSVLKKHSLEAEGDE